MLLFIVGKIRNLIAWTAEPLYCFLYGHEEDQTLWIQTMRYICNFLIGVLLAYLMWLLMSFNCNLRFISDHIFVELPVLTIFLFFNGLSFAISRNVRAITLLIFVCLGDRSGKRYLRAVVFGLVISGPINNLLNNAGEVARVFACSTTRTYNVTKTRLDLMAMPFTNTLQHMKGDIYEIQDNFKDLQAILIDLKYGIIQADSQNQKWDLKKHRRAGNTTKPAGNINFNLKLPKSSEIQQKFVHNMENRCKHQLSSGHHVCEEVFGQGFHKCATNFPNWLANAICWPYSIEVICKVNMFGTPDKVCNASKVVKSDFGKTFINLLRIENELFGNSSNIQISYKLQNSSSADEMRSSERTSEEFLKDFERKRRVFKTVMTLVEKITCLFIFYVIWTAVDYFWKYRCNVDFDNFYITDYFKHLDRRRKNSNQRSVLPLRRLEKSRTVDVDEFCSMTVAELNIDIYHMVQLALEMLTTGVFIFLDRMVVNLLHIINHRSLVSHPQEGEHEVRYRINGTGLMTRLLRTTMKNFNIHERVSTSLTNKECLPVAHVLPSSFYFKLLLIYLIIIFLIYQSIHISRLRRVVCSYFYYKREKHRILYLYGSMLRNHASYLNDVRQTAEENMVHRHVHGRTNLFLILRLSYPKYFGWLRNFNCAKRKCLVCTTLEFNFIYCKFCGFFFCQDCSREMSWVCVFCEQPLRTQASIVGSETSEDLHRYQKIE